MSVYIELEVRDFFTKELTEELLEDVYVELWDAEGIRDSPFLVRKAYKGSVKFEASSEQVVEFYGRYVSRFYFRVVEDVEYPVGGSFKAVWANTMTDKASWPEHGAFEQGVLVQPEKATEIVLYVSGRYLWVKFIDEQTSQPITDLQLFPRSVGESFLVLQPTITDSFGGAFVRVHTEEGVEVELLQDRDPLPPRGLWGGQAPDKSGVIQMDEAKVSPEFGGTIQVLRSDGAPLPNVVLELRDDEDMGKGPLRSLVTDGNGEVDLTFAHDDLLTFYGRYVDRFCFQVVDKDRGLVSDRVLLNTKRDDLGPSEPPSWFDQGLWSLDGYGDFSGATLKLTCAPHFLEVQVTDALTHTPLERGWLQLYKHSPGSDPQDPPSDDLKQVERLDSEGMAYFREFQHEGAEEFFYYLRLLTADQQPVALLPFDAPDSPTSASHEGYWHLAFPTPNRPASVERMTFQLDSERKAEISGRLLQEGSKDGVAGARVGIYGNETSASPDVWAWTNGSGVFSAELDNPVHWETEAERSKGRMHIYLGSEVPISVREVGSPEYSTVVTFQLENDEFEVVLETDEESSGQLMEIAPDTLCG